MEGSTGRQNGLCGITHGHHSSIYQVSWSILRQNEIIRT